MDLRIKRINNGYVVVVGYLDGEEWFFKDFDGVVEFLNTLGSRLVNAKNTEEIEEVLK